MSMKQTGDVLIIDAASGTQGVEFGLLIENGTVAMTQDFETAVKLSLFGGNLLDDGSADSDETWWGNLLENEDQFKLISRTQHLLRSIPATSGNLSLIEDAVKSDLAWFVSSGIASSVENIQVTIPAVGQVKITGDVNAVGLESQFSFTENWKASVGAGAPAVGIVAPAVQEVTGQSLRIEGTGSLQNGVNQPIQIANEWSQMVWFRPRADVVPEQLFSIERFGGGDTLSRIRLTTINSNPPETGLSLFVELRNHLGAVFKDYEWPNLLSLNEWAHLFVTWDGATLLVYLNGVSIPPSVIINDLDLFQALRDREIRLGGPNVTKDFYQCAVWNTPLIAAEIAEVYNAGDAGFDLLQNLRDYESAANLMHWYQPGVNPDRLGEDYATAAAVPIHLDEHDTVTSADIINDAPGVTT